MDTRLHKGQLLEELVQVLVRAEPLEPTERQLGPSGAPRSGPASSGRACIGCSSGTAIRTIDFTK